MNKHRDPRVLCNAEQPGPEPSHHGVLPLRSIVPISPVSFKCYLWPSVQSSGLTRLGHLPHLPRSQGSGNPFTPKQSSLPKANPLQMCRWPQLPLLCQTECICWAPSRLGVGEAAVVHLANLHFLALGKEHISVSTCPPPRQSPSHGGLLPTLTVRFTQHPAGRLAVSVGEEPACRVPALCPCCRDTWKAGLPHKVGWGHTSHT